LLDEAVRLKNKFSKQMSQIYGQKGAKEKLHFCVQVPRFVRSNTTGEKSA
jgi:hypothetical protein